jgi:hypothetical protein
MRAKASKALFSLIPDIVGDALLRLRAPLAREEEVLLALRLFDLVVEVAERVLEFFRLGLVRLPGLLELLPMLRVLGVAQERLLGEIVAPLLHGEHRLLLPVLRGLVLGLHLVLEALFVGDRAGHLLLGLRQLIAHVDDDLVQHLLRILGLRDQVVDVGLEQRGDAVEDAHRQRASRNDASSRMCDASARVMLS